MLKKIFLMLIVSFTGLNFVIATDWDSYDVTSIKDPLYIEMPDSIHSYIPTTITVHIKDELTKEKANYVNINPYNDRPYTDKGNPVFANSSGEFRGAMKYSGEDSISFGFRPTNTAGDVSSVVVKFVHAEVVQEGENTSTSDPASKYYGYTGCSYENNELFCPANNGCTVCYKYISIVDRDYVVNETNTVVNFPSDMDKEKESIFAYDSSASSVKELPHASGNGTYKEYEEYSLSTLVDTDTLSNTIDNHKPTNSGYTQELIGSLTEGAQANLFYKAPVITNDASYGVIQYELYSDLAPAGSGILRAKASLNTFLRKEDEKTAVEELKNNLLNTVRSYKLSPGKTLSPSRELKHSYSLYDRDAKEEIPETEDLLVFGSITDVFDNPLPYMKIRIKVAGNNNYITGTTDDDGNFQVPLRGIEVGDEDLDAVLLADLTYERDNKIYYNLNFRKDNGSYAWGYVGKKFKISKGVNPEIRFKLKGVRNDSTWITNLRSYDDVDHAGVIYYHMNQSVDFYLTELKLTLDYKLPVSVWVGNLDNNTLYSSENSDILIAASDASNSSSNRPKNREYHEFSHHVMFDVYGEWPNDDSLPESVNHGGFMNPNTADSYVEGFAEFMALVISHKLGEDKSDVYAGFGSMERNYRPWDAAGANEEFAVASLLWDMYDNDNEPGDDLYYSLETIWDVIKVNRKSFYEYYKAFKAAKPNDAEKIDALFALHGFYQDTREGNKKYDNGEPWKYINGNSGAYNFLDLSDETTKIEYEKGLLIGPATNYERPNRQSAVKLKNAFLKVTNDEVDFYTIRVTDTQGNLLESEYTVERADGKVYVQPLPGNVESIITVRPKTENYTVKNEYTVSNQKLLEKVLSVDEKKGFFDEFTFDLESTGKNVDEKYILYGGVKPNQEYEGDLDSKIEVTLDEDDTLYGEFDGGSGEKGTFPFLGVFIAILMGVYAYFYRKSTEVKKHTHRVLTAIKKYSLLSWKWFLENGVPFLKKWGIIVLENIIQGVQWLKVKIMKKIKEYKEKK